MATDAPRLAKLELPAWFWGGDIQSYFASARLRATRDDATGAVTVQTEERGARERPKLVRTTELAGLAANAPAPLVGHVEAKALRGLGLPELVRRVDVDASLERLLARARGPASPASLAAGLAAHQLQTMAAEPGDLDQTIHAIFGDITAITLAETGQSAFPNASVHFVQRDQALLHRTKLASVLLRLDHDDALRGADIRKLTEANARGELIFAASSAIGVTGDAAWQQLVDRCWHTVTHCGLPHRVRPGFWDNSGRCCGTAGVLALATDLHAEQRVSLDFATVLVDDLAARATVDDDGTRWSNHEYRVTPSDLDPRTGWAMGNAGIIRELLRYVRATVGPNPAYAVTWPDHPRVATRTTR